MNHERLIQNLEAQAMGYRAMLEALEAEAMLPGCLKLGLIKT